MGAMTEIERRGFKNGCKFISQLGKEARALQAKALRFYKQAIMEDMSDKEAFAWVIERLGSLGLTERKLRNYLERKGAGNPKADAITEAKVLLWFQQQEEDVNETREECDAELAKIDELEQSGEMRYEVEEIEEVSGEEVSRRIKRLPIIEARMLFLKRKADALDRYFNSIKKMRPDVQTFNVFGNVNKFGDLTSEDLARQIREGEKKHQIKDDVSD